MQAAQQKQRYLQSDLNRFFQPEYLDVENQDIPEWHEAQDLKATIQDLANNWHDGMEVHMLDLHSMSGDGTPFTCFPHTRLNEHFAHKLPLPAIADIVDFLPGTLVDYFSDKLTSTMVVECGQHEADITKQVGEASLASFLRITGCLLSETTYQECDAFLKEHVAEAHNIFTRVKYRYHIQHQGYFEMCPGYQNLQSIESSELMARDKHDEILAPFEGRVVLPCYQKQGDDGFFIAVDDSFITADDSSGK